MSKKILVAAVAALALGATAQAQTNLQTFYDFGKNRNHFTTTLEGFYNDNWGNTFFFIDYDYNAKDTKGVNQAPSGSYMEIARCINLWQNTPLSMLSLQVEYNGLVGVNQNFLFGTDIFLHSADFNNTFNFKVLYKWIDYAKVDDPNRTMQTYINGDPYKSNVPLQFTFVWGMQDLFGVKGLRFSGFADFWWQDHDLFNDNKGEAMTPEVSHFVFLSEPQIWYNVGQHFGCDNLNIGGEVELSYDFGTARGFWCRPCAGIKWVF